MFNNKIEKAALRRAVQKFITFSRRVPQILSEQAKSLYKTAIFHRFESSWNRICCGQLSAQPQDFPFFSAHGWGPCPTFSDLSPCAGPQVARQSFQKNTEFMWFFLSEANSDFEILPQWHLVSNILLLFSNSYSVCRLLNMSSQTVKFWSFFKCNLKILTPIYPS